MEFSSYTWITDNFYALEESEDLECKYIHGLYLFLLDLESDGLHGYLTNSSSDEFAYVAQAITLDSADGKVWVTELENIFGGEVPENRDDRIDRILPMTECDDDRLGRLTDVLNGLLPKLDIMLERLIEKKKIDSGWRPNPVKYPFGKGG